MEYFLGGVILFAGNFTPANWLDCDGQLLQIKDHMALFSLLGTVYGGDGVTTFALPTLKAPEQGLRYLISVNGVYPNRQE
jgi:microcystin-dependent protein